MAAIYQRARPITFDQVVGQEHVKDVLTAAIARGRVTHAYLFSGPRGVGKTTTARLLAMAVNCEGSGERPCGACESCRLVRHGSHPDVIELDAASNNSVEDVRELREKVQLAPLRGGKRVWVLDEAHMLSRAAANALLKTLEEPPENLIFVLATTEPEKLPPTILSRCQHFRFRRLSEREIASKLARLCQEASVQADEDALALLAKAADGAMRDAESLLERLFASGESITRARAEDALGLPPQERLYALAGHFADGDLAATFAEAGALYRDGFAPRTLAEQLKATLRDALARKLGAGDGPELSLSQEALLRAIHTLDDEDERFSRRGDLFSLEVALIKTLNATRGQPQPSSEADQPPEAAEARSQSLPDFDPTGRGAPPPSAKREPPLAAPPARETAEAPKVSWHKVLSQAGPQLKAFMMPAQADIQGSHVVLRFPESHKFHFDQLKRRQDELLALLERSFGQAVSLQVLGPGEALKKKS
jgi:DNA polymerase-3 subunit gamma/tau